MFLEVNSCRQCLMALSVCNISLFLMKRNLRVQMAEIENVKFIL